MTSTQIKMCGMTRAEDVIQAIELEVHFIGLILAKQSKRCLSIERAAELARLCDGTDTQVVALLMDDDVETVYSAMNVIQPDVLQFHGQESSGFCAQFDLPFVKAIGMKHIHAVDDLLIHCRTYAQAKAWVLDAHARGEAGGSGQVFDWEMLCSAELKPMVRQRVWLAGGLHPSNVAQAVATVQPSLVDVASGIEASPGVKDHGKMSSFVTAVRKANHHFHGSITQKHH